MNKSPTGITKLTVRGFKSICEEQSIDIRPLTILAGANSSGKSSFMQPLLLLKQTIEAPSDPGALLLDGPNLRFTSAEQLLCHVGVGCSEFAVAMQRSDGCRLSVIFKRDKESVFSIPKMAYTDSGHEEVSISPQMTHQDILAVLPPPLKAIHESIAKTTKTQQNWHVYRERCFLSFDLRSPEDNKRRGISFGRYGMTPASDFISHLERIIHLPGLRGNPKRNYPKTGGDVVFPGTFETYVASVVYRWQSTSSSELDQLGRDLESLGLTWKVDAKPVDDTQVELRVGRLKHAKRGGAQDLVSIADVGFGVSQTLPVLVALLAARPGQMVYLEQPEIHLHPWAQRQLAHVLAAAAKRGVIVVAETHSALLLREVQTLVATKQLTPSLVRLNWLQRNEEGATTVTPADLDDRGAYGRWPEDFDKTELDTEQAYLDAVEGIGGSP